MSAPPSTDGLDTDAALRAKDPQDMLRAVATGAAQVREAAMLAGEAGLELLAGDGRPRAMVVTGMGGSGIAGDVLAAVAGPTCPVPVLTHRGYGLPGWVGATDLVVAVSCSGSTEETLSATDEAIRRGCRLLVVGGTDSPLAERAVQSRAPFVAVPGGRQPRASLWALSTPVVLAGHALGLVSAPAEVIEATAARLEGVSARCRPSSDAFVNPAKSLARDLLGAVPMIWGTSPLAGTVAYRFACQLAENAKLPAAWGVLPEANHNMVVAFDGPFGGGPGRRDDDLFRDRVDDPDSGPGLHLVLLRDRNEHPQVLARVAASRELAEQRGIGVTELVAEGTSAFEQLASLVGLVDYTSVYLALLEDIDPTPVEVIEDLKARIRE
ncbi:MAG: bifunctional phosphoglucose/phosphomannose isomerase [Actinomycetota bacterium]|nr:bifunctional phosphoglucose/phosphomannose isomerase [Actinomycetota bacterium]